MIISPLFVSFQRFLNDYNISMKIQTDTNNLQDAPNWSAIYSNRRDRLRKELLVRGLDAFLVSHAANRFYLSGFELHDGQPGETAGMLVISASGEDWLATDGRFEEAAAALWPKERTLIYHKIVPEIADLLRRSGAIIGIEGRYLSRNFASALACRCGAIPALVDAGALVEQLRIIKEPCEISSLRASFSLNHALLAWLEQDIARFGGISEREFAWEVEKFFRENGAQELAFPTIAASGVNAARPHAQPGETLVPTNGSFLLDLGCRVQNYCSDQTRSWWIGPNPAAEFTRALELTQKAQKAAMDMMRPGVACEDVFNTALKVFEDAGTAKAFNHGLGHGVGLETHEAPSMSRNSTLTLRQGMVITVEPGLYFPHWGGVRWEHTVLVEADGVSIL